MKKIILSLLLSFFLYAANVNGQFGILSIGASGPTQVCSPGSVTITVTSLPPGNWITFEWRRMNLGCNTITSNTTAGFGGFHQAGLTGLYACIAYDDLGNSIASQNAILVRILPAAGSTTLLPLPIAGGSVSCVSSVNLCVPNVFSMDPVPPTIRWYKNNVLISGAISSEYTATATGYYKYQIVAACNSPYSDSILVTIGTPQSATITAGGPVTFCQGGNVLLSANTGVGFTYVWKNNGATIAGATASDYTATATGNYTCVVTTPACGPSTSNAIAVSVNNLPTGGVIPVVPAPFCAGGSVVLTSVSSGFGLAWQWKKDGINISGATSSSYTATTAGSYTVVVTNLCGSATSTPRVVTVNPLPTATITPVGPTGLCTGGSVLLNASTGTGYTYQWKRNGTNISGATGSSYTATVAGSYTVTIANSCGIATSVAVIVTISSSAPPKPGTISGPATFCANQTGVVYSIAPVATAGTYFWIVPSGASIVSGQSTTSITVNFGNKSGNVKVNAGNACGFGPYQTKKVTKNCREDFGEEELESAAIVYPNPSSGDFNFEISNTSEESISIQVFDVIGQLVLSEANLPSQFTIRNPQLIPGVYSAVIIVGGKRKVLRIIKTN